MTNAKHFNIKLKDLTFEKQEEIIKEFEVELQKAAELEGKEFLTRKWEDPKPTTWQEAYCRIYNIDYVLWQDEVESGVILTPPFMWESYQEAYTRQVAESRLM